MSDEMKDLVKVYCNFCRAPLGEFADGFRARLTCRKCRRLYDLSLENGLIRLTQVDPEKSLLTA